MVNGDDVDDDENHAPVNAPRAVQFCCRQIVHGGVTALTFDNLFGTALFLQNTGAVVTAYLKVKAGLNPMVEKEIATALGLVDAVGGAVWIVIFLDTSAPPFSLLGSFTPIYFVFPLSFFAAFSCFLLSNLAEKTNRIQQYICIK